MNKCAGFLVFVLASGLWADTVHLKDGTSLRGRVRARNEDKVVFEYEPGKFKTIPTSDIQNIEKDDFKFPPSSPTPRSVPEAAPSSPLPSAETKAGESRGLTGIAEGPGFKKKPVDEPGSLSITEWRLTSTVEASFGPPSFPQRQRMTLKNARDTFLVVRSELSEKAIRQRMAQPKEKFAKDAKVYVLNSSDFAAYLADGKRIEGNCFAVFTFYSGLETVSLEAVPDFKKPRPGVLETQVVFVVPKGSRPLRYSYFGQCELSTQFPKK